MGELYLRAVDFLYREGDVIVRAWKPLLLIIVLIGGGTWWGTSKYYEAHYQGIIHNLETAREAEAKRRELAEDTLRRVQAKKESDPQSQRAQVYQYDTQRQLIATLRKYGGDPASIDIHFANNKQRPLADTLQSIFELAEWKAHVTNVPFDAYMHRHFPGIEVRGYNKHLVEAVAGALTTAELPEVWPNTQNPSIERDDQGWTHAQRRIELTIGHINE